MRGVIAQQFLGPLQNVAHLLGSNTGKLLKEIIHRASPCQSVKQ